MSNSKGESSTQAKNEAVGGVSRRRFLKGAAVSAAGAAIGDQIVQGAQPQPASAADAPPGTLPLKLNINGKETSLNCEPRTTLLNAMRDHIEPACTSAKLVCGMGTCGACTAIVDGKPVYSCLMLAADAEGKTVVTAEGLGTPEKMNAVQQAFCDKDALMCGFCTPGYVTAISAYLQANEGKIPSQDEVKEACKGNFCRCGTYPRVFEAALAAAQSGAKA